MGSKIAVWRINETPPFVFNGKFQPRSSGKLHFGGKKKSFILLKSFDTPEVQGVADLKHFRIAPPPPNADTTAQQIQKTPHSP